MRLTPLLFLVCALPAGAWAQDSAIVVRGKVLSAESREGIGGASMLSIACGDQVKPDTALLLTDHDGSFLLGPLQKGLQCLTVRALGYKSYRDTLDAESMAEELAEIMMVPDSLAGGGALMFARPGTIHSLEGMTRLVLVGALLTVACTEAPAVAPPPAPTPSIPKAVIVSPTGLTINVQDSLRLSADSNVGETAFTWFSNSPLIASVSSAGWVKGLAAGSVAITACGFVKTSVCGSASFTVR